MNKNNLIVWILIAFFTLSCSVKDDGRELERIFQNPPELTQPWVYWYWESGNISKEGITKDLEAMAQAGIGEAFISAIYEANIPQGKVDMLSDEYFDCIEHAITEAGRLGLKIGVFNCPGWSMAGGPWVGAQEASRYLVSSEIRVQGGQHIHKKLSIPKEPFQQVKVQAFPAPESDAEGVHSLPHRVSGSVNGLEKLFDGDKSTAVSFTEYPVTINVKLNEPTTMRSIQFFPVDVITNTSYTLEYRNDLGNWQNISKGNIAIPFTNSSMSPTKFPSEIGSFKSVTAKEFRITLNGPYKAEKYAPVIGRFAEIELGGGARLPHHHEKQMDKMSLTQNWNGYMWERSPEPERKSLTVDVTKVIDLTSMVDDQGVLNWDAPAGDWVILRTGMTPVGATNAPTSPAGRGYEVDKINKEYVEAHFDAYIGRILKQIPPEKRKSWVHVVADSYEQGPMNWTEGFAEIFINKYNYDPHPWLPVLTGRVVETAEQSDRFLWDLRRLVADQLASEFIITMRNKCHENGLRLWLENYGGWGFPGEFLSYGAGTDDISGEFWSLPAEYPKYIHRDDIRAAASCARIYGKNVVSAEAFTSTMTFRNTPRDLKVRGDFAMAEGINHFVHHLYIHQPDDSKPGISAWYGTDFNRSTTWFSQLPVFNMYLRRSSALLQQGERYADIAYFIGEDTPNTPGMKDSDLPRGYDYDFVNADVLNNAVVKDGRIVLSSGANYAILVLRDQTTIRPELLEKISNLVSDGAVILGPKPQKSPSLQDYPASDKKVQQLAAQLWGAIDEKTVIDNEFGKGYVYAGISVEEALKQRGVLPDVIVPEDFLFLHRNKGNIDIYFVTNQTHERRSETISFNVSGKQPELWDAVTGEIRSLPEYAEENGRINVPLEFNETDSWFIIFREKSGAKSEGVNFPKKVDIQDIYGAWEVSFDSTMGAPAHTIFDTLTDWTVNVDKGIKYYSGTATYKKEFEFTGDVGKESYYLDLGIVDPLAVVRLNGKSVGTLWRKPYTIEITKELINGKNSLEVDIINAWWNRLVGDEQAGAKRYLNVLYGSEENENRDIPLRIQMGYEPQLGYEYHKVPWKIDHKLIPAGLQGPVKIKTMN